MRQENIDALAEIFQEHGISVTCEQIESISEDFEGHLDMMREMESHRFLGSKKPECESCKRLRQELTEMTKQRDIYHKNVCVRRETTDVWIDGETVMYRP